MSLIDYSDDESSPAEVILPKMPEVTHNTMRVVIHDGRSHRIVGFATQQPPDIIEYEGVKHGLIALKFGHYYEYRPIISPNEVMANFRGDGTFKPNQR